MLFIFDNNFIIDQITRRDKTSNQYAALFLYLIKTKKAALSSSQIHNLRYVFNKHYNEYENDYLNVNCIFLIRLRISTMKTCSRKPILKII